MRKRFIPFGKRADLSASDQFLVPVASQIVSLFQIRVDGIPPPAQNALLYETVTVVEGKPILRDMVFSPDHQYIYLLSERQVRTPEGSRYRSEANGSEEKKH